MASQSALLVKQPFDGYVTGALITDPAAMAAALNAHPEDVVLISLPGGTTTPPSNGGTTTSGGSNTGTTTGSSSTGNSTSTTTVVIQTPNPAATAASLAALRAIVPGGSASPAAVLVQGHTTPGDGADRWAYWNPTSTATDNGATVIAPSSSTGAGRWVVALGAQPSLNVRWFGALGDGATDDSAAFTAAIAAAAPLAVPVFVPAGRYVVSLTVTDEDIWLTGSGTLIHQQAKSVLTVNRTPGPAVAVSAIGTALVGTVTGNEFTDMAVTETTLTVPSVAGMAQGQIWLLSSEDAYPWSPPVSGVPNTGITSAQVWQSQLFRIQGLGLAFTGGVAGQFAEQQTVSGAKSSAVGLIRSLVDGASGTLVFNTITGSFVVGENLVVAGKTFGQVAANPFVISADRIYDSYATATQMQLFGQAKFILDGLSVDANGDTDSVVGVANRQPAFVLQGLYQPVIRNFTIHNAWTRCLQLLTCWQGDVAVFIEKLPNDANLSEGAYGYGVELGGSTDGTRVSVRGGNCRHAVTTNVYWGGYKYMGTWVRGNPKHCHIHDCVVRDCFNAALDNHWGCYFLTYENCVVHGPSHVNRATSGSVGFQNRSFGTRYIDCQVIDAVDAFIDGSTNLAATFLHTITYIDCHAIDFQQNGFVAVIASATGNNRLEYRNCSARGDGRAVNAPYVQSGYNFANSNYIRMLGCTAERFNAYPIQIAQSGRVEIIDFFAYYRDNANFASGLRFDGAPAELQIINYRVFYDAATGSPTAIFRNAFNGPLAINLAGTVGCVNSNRAALIQNTAGGTTTLNWRDFSYAAAHPVVPLQTKRWYGPTAQTIDQAPAAAALTAIPYAITTDTITLSAFGVLVTTAGAGGTTIQLGLYADNAGQPGTLIVDAGHASTDVAGEAIATLAASIPLSRGIVWIAAQLQSAGTTAPILACMAAGSSSLAQLGGATPKALMGQVATLGVAGAGATATGALPASFPSPGYVTAGGLAVPYIAVQLSPSAV